MSCVEPVFDGNNDYLGKISCLKFIKFEFENDSLELSLIISFIKF